MLAGQALTEGGGHTLGWVNGSLAGAGSLRVYVAPEFSLPFSCTSLLAPPPCWALTARAGISPPLPSAAGGVFQFVQHGYKPSGAGRHPSPQSWRLRLRSCDRNHLTLDTRGECGPGKVTRIGQLCAGSSKMVPPALRFLPLSELFGEFEV